ncbi:hypothetical protein Tco_0713793, partial [Tanacetum coccineum]
MHGEVISQEDINQKFLRSLSQEWTMHTIVWRNKLEIETLSLDDLFNNLKAYKSEVKRTSSSTTNSHNSAFLSSSSTNSTARAVNTAQGVNTACTQGAADSSTTVENLSDVGKKIPKEYWKGKPETMCQQRRGIDFASQGGVFQLPQEMTLCKGVQGTQESRQQKQGAYQKDCAKCVKNLKEQNEQLVKDLRTTRISVVSYKTGLESVEARLVIFKKNESVYEEDIKLLKCEVYLRDLDITELKRKLELVTKEKDEVQLTVQKFENSSKSLSELLDRQIMDKCKTGVGYNGVPPPYTGNFMPPKHNLVYPNLDDFVEVNKSASESVVEKPIVETNEPKNARKENRVPIIEDWVSESEEENVPRIKTVEMFNKPSFAKINFVKSTKQVKSPRKISVNKNRQNTPSPRGNKRNWNHKMSQKLGNDFEMFTKACHMCGSFEHLRKDYNNWYNNQRTAVNNVGPMKNVINNAYSIARRTFNKITAANNSTFNKRVNTINDKNVNAARPNAVVNTASPKAVLSAVKGNKRNAVKASACWVWRPKHKVLDHGRNDDNLIFDTGILDEQEVEVEKVISAAEVTTASATTTTIDELILAQTLIEIKVAKPKAVITAATTATTAVTRPKARGVVVQEPSEFTTTTSSSQLSQLPHAKDKGKEKMVDPEKPLKKKDQILIDEEIAQRLQEELQ